MIQQSGALVLWAPRVAGILVAAFLALFAIDAFDGRRFADAAPAFAMHLVPSAIVLAIVAFSWRLQWIGGAALIGLAILYGVMARGRLDWIAVISGPLLLVGLLFLLSWWYHGSRRATG